MDPSEAGMRPTTGHRPGRDGARLREARAHLRRADPVLARLIDERPDFDPRGWMAALPVMDLYGALLFQVAGQQLSVASTRRILARIEALRCSAVTCPPPSSFCGPIPACAPAALSGRKVATLRDLAERVADGGLNLAVLGGLPDEEIMAQLTAIPE